jgi:hypothetical protein
MKSKLIFYCLPYLCLSGLGVWLAGAQMPSRIGVMLGPSVHLGFFIKHVKQCLIFANGDVGINNSDYYFGILYIVVWLIGCLLSYLWMANTNTRIAWLLGFYWSAIILLNLCLLAMYSV